jgi:hypothetical protein
MDYTFLASLADEIALPEKGILSTILHKDEYVNIAVFGCETGYSPHTLRQASRPLVQRQIRYGLVS